jgi:hypothetical protein
LFSCQKEADFNLDDILSEKSATIVQDEITVDNVESEVNYEADFYANAEKSLSLMAGKGQHWGWKNILRYKINQCPNVTIDTAATGYPKTITLNYGNGTELRNGRVLSGVITIVISAPPRTDGATKTVTYNNFSVDSVSVTGSVVFEFIGDFLTSRKHTQAGNLTFTLPEGKIITRQMDKIVEWISGLNTPEDMTDDVIQITGSVQVSTSENNEYIKEITTPLIKLGDCRWFVQGIVEISLNGETKMVIDYGNGECDDHAIITKNGNSREIDLKGKRPIVNRGKR